MSDQTQISRPNVVIAIASLRQEWQQTASAGISLIDVNGSAGLILYDLAVACNLSELEMTDALGSRLFRDLTAIVSQQVY